MKTTIETKYNISDTLYWIEDDEVKSGIVRSIEIVLGNDGLSIAYCVEGWYIEEGSAFANKKDALLKLNKDNKRNLLKEIKWCKERLKRDKEELQSLKAELMKTS